MAAGMRTVLIRFLGDQSGLSKETDKAETKLERFGSAVQTAVNVAGAAAGAALGAGFAQAVSFDAAGDKLAAQLDLTAAESERVGGVAGDLFSDAYGSSIEEVNSALRGIIAQTGDLGDVTNTELENMGAAALDLAAAFDGDVNRVVQVAGQAMSTGLADNMTEAFDLIAAASQQTMPGLEQDLLDAADEYGIFFAQLGLSGEEAFGALAAASEQGQFGIDKTGDALKEFTIRATDMSTASTDAFDAIGLDAQTMAADILAGGDTARGAFDQIIAGLLSMEDPTAQANAAIALFGTPIEDLSTAQIPEFLSTLDTSKTSLEEVGGAAADLGDTLNDNAAVGWESFKRTAMESLGNVFMPMLPALQSTLQWLQPFAPMLGPIAIAIVAVTAAQWLWNVAMAANPIGLIIIGIAALIGIIVLLVQNWDTVKQWAIDAWNAIWDKLKAFGSWLKDVFWTNGLKPVFDRVGATVSWVRDTFQAGFERVKGYATGLIDKVGSIPDKIGEFFSGLADTITQPFRSGFNAVANLWNNTVGQLSWTIPDWVPKIGGGTLSVPQIPTFHQGGIIPGPIGSPQLIMALGGEEVLTREQQRSGGGDFTGTLVLDSGEFLGYVHGVLERRDSDLKRRVRSGGGRRSR